LNKLLRPLVRLVVRVLFPGIAQSLEQEGQFDLHKHPGALGDVDVSRHLDVENNGSDTTLICFAGMAVLYAAMPKFEFRKTLAGTGGTYNYVWVRDIYRSYYDLAPDGSPNGLAFYAHIIGDALERLGATHNIAIGASGGGAAAFAFSGLLPIHQIITFNPAFPINEYGSWKNLRGILFNISKLIWQPKAYVEVLFVALGVRFLYWRSRRTAGIENMMNPLECYCRKNPPARATVFFSTNSLPDARQILQFHNLPTVAVIPIVSERHNCMAELKQRGELGSIIHAAIQNGMPVR